jgi:hypothetical protein
VNVGVLDLSHLGMVTAARVSLSCHEVWRGDVGWPRGGVICAVAGWRRRVSPTRGRRGLVHESRRSALCPATPVGCLLMKSFASVNILPFDVGIRGNAMNVKVFEWV